LAVVSVRKVGMRMPQRFMQVRVRMACARLNRRLMLVVVVGIAVVNMRVLMLETVVQMLVLVSLT
jgi:hypothetical protein